jgi:hypothetical protein
MGAYTWPVLAVVGAGASMGVIGTGSLAGALAGASSGGVHRRGVLHVSVVFPYCETGPGREEGDLKRGRGMFPSTAQTAYVDASPTGQAPGRDR